MVEQLGPAETRGRLRGRRLSGTRIKLGPEQSCSTSHTERRDSSWIEVFAVPAQTGTQETRSGQTDQIWSSGEVCELFYQHHWWTARPPCGIPPRCSKVRLCTCYSLCLHIVPDDVHTHTNISSSARFADARDHNKYAN